MFVVAGLGNPGAQYAQTRHNAGFWVIERLAAQLGVGARDWSARGGSSIAKCSLPSASAHRSIDLVLALPQQFMNRSGQALQPVLAFFKVEPQSLIVVHDELDLDPGILRLKRGGGAGGHNGISDVMQQLGTDDFFRVRVGIGHPRRAFGTREARPGANPASWVLAPAAGEERRFLEGAADAAVEAVRMLITDGLTAAQQRFHPQSWERPV